MNAAEITKTAAQLHAEEVRRKQMERMVDGARRYAAADKSDPFTFDRVMAHTKGGLTSTLRPANREYDIEAGATAFYDATPYQEPRSYIHEGREIEYSVTAYKNLVRP